MVSFSTAKTRKARPRYNGFLGAWNGAPIPPQIVQFPNGSVDVNGDGKSNGVFMGSQDISLYDLTTQRKRKSANASFQIDFGGGFTFTSDYFYAHQDEWDRNIGIQFNSTNWQGATYVPLQSQQHRRHHPGSVQHAACRPVLGRFADLRHLGVREMAG